MSAVKVGDLVHVGGKLPVWRVVGFAGRLVQLRPVPSTGRLVSETELTPASEDEA